MSDIIREDGTPVAPVGFSMRSLFKFGDAVVIDKGTVTGCVIGFAFYSHGAQVLVAWWNNGSLVEQWVADWRVDLVEEK